MNSKHPLFPKAEKIRFMVRMAHRFVKSPPLGNHPLFLVLGGRESVQKERFPQGHTDSQHFIFPAGNSVQQRH